MHYIYYNWTCLFVNRYVLADFSEGKRDEIMKKIRKYKILSLFLILTTSFLLCSYTKVYDDTQKKIIDVSNRLDKEAEKELQKKCVEYSEKTKLDISILIQDEIGNIKAETFTDDYYDTHHMGYDNGGSGILLLISNHDLYINTSGIAIAYFNDKDIERILTNLDSSWYDYDYYTTSNIFLEEVLAQVNTINANYPETVEPWFEGDYDDYSIYDEEYHISNPAQSSGEGFDPEDSYWFIFLCSAGLATIIIICCAAWAGRTKNTTNANTYLDKNNFKIVTKKDVFLHTTVSKSRKESSASGRRSSGHSGGSYHRSRSGASHGGGGHRR